MPRLIFCIAILVLLVILLAKLGHRIYWRIRNRMNHCKGRVVKRMCKSKGKVLYYAQIYRDFVGWEDIPGLHFDNISDAMTAMDKALERTFAELANDNDEQIIVEREYKPRRR